MTKKLFNCLIINNKKHIKHKYLYTILANTANQLDKAWQHLEEGHVIEILHREVTSSESEENVERNTQSIKTVFQKGFWDAFPGSTLDTPVFIVGMMRLVPNLY